LIKILFPYESSGYAIPLADGKWAIVDMGCERGLSFLSQMTNFNIDLKQISLVALTHLHADHVDIDGLVALLKNSSCDFICPKLCFDQIKLIDQESNDVSELLQKSNRLTLVDDKFSMDCNGVAIKGVPTIHELHSEFILGANFSYRINNCIISGDTPVHSLFKEDHCDYMMGNTGIPVEYLILNLAQLSVEDITSQDYVDEFRKNKYQAAHGILHDFLDVLGNELFKPFFIDLHTLIPTHIRRLEIKETYDLYVKEIQKKTAIHSYSFEITSS